MFANTDLLADALAYSPGSSSIDSVERAVDALKREGRLHDANALGKGLLTTDKAVADERETVSLMRKARAVAGRRCAAGWWMGI